MLIFIAAIEYFIDGVLKKIIWVNVERKFVIELRHLILQSEPEYFSGAVTE